MGTLWQDLRYGIRMLAKNPGFTAVAIITLALGIGANTAIFSVVNAVVLRPLPYADAGRLISLEENGHHGHQLSISYPDLLDWQQQNQVFENIAGFQSASFNLAGEYQPERIPGRNVTHNFFATLGATPFLGRDFLPEDDHSGANPVVIVSHSFWERVLGADPNAIGKTLPLNGRAYMIVGVLPADFRFYLLTDLYAPIGLNAEELSPRAAHAGIYGIGRLKAGITLEQARAQMDTIAQRLQREYSNTNSGTGATLTELRDDLTGEVRPVVLILFAAVGFLLLICCMNVANLLLARAASRTREIAIRTAIGATRMRLFSQLLTESVLLGVLGGGLGLLIGAWGTSAFAALLPAGLRRVAEINIDARVFAFTLAISLLAGMIFGLAPALHSMRLDLNTGLRDGGKSSRFFSGHELFRNVLVISEIALSLVLLTGAGLMIRSFASAMNVNLGLNPKNILTMQVFLPDSKYHDDAQAQAFFDQLSDRLKGIPGVEASGFITPLPLSGEGWQDAVLREGLPQPKPGQFPTSDFHVISSGYFQAMGIQLLEGRDFRAADDHSSPAVAIISQSMAKKYWPDEDPVGKRFQKGGGHGKTTMLTVVGIAADTKQYGPAAKTLTEFYLPYRQSPLQRFTLVVRTKSDPLAMQGAVREQVQALDKGQPVYAVQTMEQIVDSSLSSRRTNTQLLAGFAALALLLAAIGIYGVMAYFVTQRTNEIGVRVALGAQKRNILRLIVGKGTILTLAGAAIGVAASFGATRFLQSLLFGVSATDPLTFFVVPLLLCVVALAACYIPARRAMRVDPMVALRYE
jgi:putative ABC transport system permease protein